MKHLVAMYYQIINKYNNEFNKAIEILMDKNSDTNYSKILGLD